MDKQALLTEIERRREQIESILQQYSPEQFDTPNAVGKWSIKNILAHVTFWEGRLVPQLDTLARGEQWMHLTDDDDTVNERVYQATRGQTVEETLARFWQMYGELTDYVRNAPEALITERSAILPDQILSDEIVGRLEHIDEHLLALPAPAAL